MNPSIEKSSRQEIAEVQGLAGWLAGLLRSWRGDQVVHQRQLHLLETLALGGKRQLILVSCGEARFLIGASVEGVETIVRVETRESSSDLFRNEGGI